MLSLHPVSPVRSTSSRTSLRTRRTPVRWRSNRLPTTHLDNHSNVAISLYATYYVCTAPWLGSANPEPSLFNRPRVGFQLTPGPTRFVSLRFEQSWLSAKMVSRCPSAPSEIDQWRSSALTLSLSLSLSLFSLRKGKAKQHMGYSPFIPLLPLCALLAPFRNLCLSSKNGSCHCLFGVDGLR